MLPADILKEETRKAVIKESEQIDNEWIEDLRDDDNLDDKEKIMQLLKHKYSFYTDNSNKNLDLYVWTGKIWDDNIKGIIYKELYILFGDKKTHVTYKEIEESLKGQGQFTKVKPKPPHLVVINNGMFNIDTKEVIPHSKEWFYVNLVPRNYDPNNKYPVWDKFLHEVHHPYDLDFIQEYFGYCLYTSCPTKAFLMCLGGGDNGKSIELETLINTIGRKNNTCITLQKLNKDQFSIAELYHKLTNISDDISNEKISKTGALKSISDGREITGEFKYGQQFDFIPYSKPISAMNILPEIDDDTESFWSRLKAVNYPYKFVNNPIEENERQRIDRETLMGMLEKEYDGILNWMLEGLIRLKKNNFVFSYNKGTKEVRDYYLNRSNPVNAWINKELHYVGDNTKYILKHDIYNICLNWVTRKGIIPVPSERKFFIDLKKADIIDTRISELDYVRAYIGYEIVKEPKENLFFPEKDTKPLIDCQDVNIIDKSVIYNKDKDTENKELNQSSRQPDSAYIPFGKRQELDKLEKDLKEFGKEKV